MSKKLIVFFIVMIIFVISIFIEVLISKQIISVPTNSNEILNSIEENENKDNQDEIIFTSYLYDKDNPIKYTITEEEKIREIKEYINKIEWTETGEKIEACLWKIEIKDEDKKTLLLRGEYDNNTAIVTVQNRDKSTTYKISKNNYTELVGFASKKYYLHKSKLEKPTKEICEKAQRKALEGLSKSEIKEVQKILRETHTMIEKRLIEAVKLVKDPNSLYWKKFTIDEVYQDPYSGVYVKSDGFYIDVKNLKKIEYN